MPLIPYTLSPILTHYFFDSLGIAQVKLVSMVIVNNGLLSGKRHELYNIISRDPKSNDLLVGFTKKVILGAVWGLLSS